MSVPEGDNASPVVGFGSEEYVTELELAEVSLTWELRARVRCSRSAGALDAVGLGTGRGRLCSSAWLYREALQRLPESPSLRGRIAEAEAVVVACGGATAAR